MQAVAARQVPIETRAQLLRDFGQTLSAGEGALSRSRFELGSVPM